MGKTRGDERRDTRRVNKAGKLIGSRDRSDHLRRERVEWDADNERQALKKQLEADLREMFGAVKRKGLQLKGE